MRRSGGTGRRPGLKILWEVTPVPVRFRFPAPCFSYSSVYNAGWSSLVARRAHNPKVGGSNPPPATIKASVFRMPFFFYEKRNFMKKRVMRQTSVVAQAVIANAARRMQRAITGAAVKTASSEQRDKSSFGHRKPARSYNPKVGGSYPPPATIENR